MTAEVVIAGRRISDVDMPFVIAEVAQAHDGSLGAAHAFIDAAAGAGASAIKFQTHIAREESTVREPWRIKFSQQDATRYDYWKRMEFSEDQWRGLKQHCDEQKIVFLSSPFSMAAVDLLERLQVPAWKVGSGEIDNHPFLARVAKTKLPVLLSSGMSSFAELDAAVAIVKQHDAPFAIFQCTTAYPCPPQQWGFNVMQAIAGRYGVPVGLSDHSSTTAASVAAVALGASMLKMHICFSRAQFGPDTSSSVTIDELAAIVQQVRLVKTALLSPVDKDAIAAEKAPMKKIFGKSVVVLRAMKRGDVVAAADLGLKKPGNGLPANALPGVIGQRLTRDVDADDALSEGDLQ
jgi:N,N'-diacetyllegionaminate synthase